MKNLLITIILMVCMSVIFTGCVNKQNENNQNNENQNQEVNQEKPKEIIINESYDVKEEIKEIKENTRLNTIKEQEENKDTTQYTSGDSSGEKITKKEAIDFSDLPGVTYEHIAEVEEKSITDVWLIKMSNANQYEKILDKVNNRLKELREEHKENKYINAILNREENIRIKEEQGVVIAVFAPDAGAIMSEIDRSFMEDIEELEEIEIQEEIEE